MIVWDNLRALFGLLDRLLSFGYKRRAAVFDEVLHPLFQRFLEVHSHYNEMYLSTLRRTPDLSARSIMLQDRPIDVRQVQRHLKAAKKRFHTLRERDIHLRDRLRREAQEILLAVEHAEEKRFLLALMQYFLGGILLAPAKKVQDGFIASIEVNGGDTLFRSPSFFSESRLAQTDDPSEAHQLLTDHLNLLNQRFTDVCAGFVKLQLAVARSRP